MIMEIVNFIFRNFWTFTGTVILLSILGKILIGIFGVIITAIRGGDINID